MKWIIIALAASGIISLAFINTTKKSVNKSVKHTELKEAFSPVVVLELFTSEGCSSCPPADNLLPLLAKQNDAVIPLSFHVDYWNRLGWTDPFSSAVYSERQRDYSRQFNNESVYTPQLVVNGEYEMVGSNRSKAEAAIKKALKENSSVQLSVEKFSRIDNRLTIISHAKGELNKNDLEIALVQTNATMDIKAGENRGVKLSHTNVVRVFNSQVLKESNQASLSIPADLADTNWEVVLFSRSKSDLKITGAVRYSSVK